MTLLMGILNLTPDSFSGDGVTDAESAHERFSELVEAGADMIDIGAESTRPGADALSAAEEWARLEAVLPQLISHPQRSQVRLSLDTYHAENAARALDLGVEIINDVSALRHPAMRALLADAPCQVIVMHSITVPADKSVTLPDDCDVIRTLIDWKAELLEISGIPAERLIFDPGIGFGKTAAQSMEIIQRFKELKFSGGRWLIGHSRKSFLDAGDNRAAKDLATLSLSQQLMVDGVDILRVHDVASHALQLQFLQSADRL